MGLCSSIDQDAKAQNQNINDSIDNQQKGDQRIIKILLLGPGDSGKSTLFKQTNMLYGKDVFNQDKRRNYSDIVYQNVMKAIQSLIENTEYLAEEEEIEGTLISKQNEVHKAALIDLDEQTIITEELAKHIKELWQDPGIRKTWAHRNKYHVSESWPYFANRLDEISKKDYVPTKLDVLRSRARTTGIQEFGFEINDYKFVMCDVGGQRNERKKWIHCFDGVSAVIFVVAMSEYNQGLYEDENVNRMHESLNLFEEIINSHWFADASIILFLNKRDIFYEKIQRCSLKVCFPDYQEDDDEYDKKDIYDETISENLEGRDIYDYANNEKFRKGSEFIIDKFEENHTAYNELSIHTTCATDGENIKKVFKGIRDILLNLTLGGNNVL